jgi:putative transposase
MIYTFIRSHEKIVLIEKMCKVLQVGQRSYYHWKSQCISERKQRILLVKEKITYIYFDLKQRYGSLRIAAELSSLGTKSSRITTANYMQKLGLRSKLSTKFKITTHSKHKYLIIQNILKRAF